MSVNFMSVIFMSVIFSQPITIIMIRRNVYCSASDLAYCHPFLRSVVCLSGCRSSYSCTAPCLKCSTVFFFMPFGKYTCGVRRHVVLDGGPWPPRRSKGRFGPRPKCALAYLRFTRGQNRSAISPIIINDLWWWHTVKKLAQETCASFSAPRNWDTKREFLAPKWLWWLSALD